jgi:thioredoxin 1
MDKWKIIMKSLLKSQNLILIVLVILILPISYLAQEKKEDTKRLNKNAKITFIELGSVNCIPCKKMQPIMDSIEEKYGDQIDVIFYDVWKTEGKPFASKYGIRLIPTQVFLDQNGKEFHRHEGFYPEKEIDKILKEKGLTPKAENK